MKPTPATWTSTLPDRLLSDTKPANAAQKLRHPRFRLDRYLEPMRRSSLAEDVRNGLTAAPKRLPPKYFYDDRGSRLFDAICDTPEYYPTRTEQALLQGVAAEIAALTQPTHLIELGSGTSRKTRVLLDALMRRGSELCYIPMDVSEGMLRRTALALRSEYPRLRVHAIAGDYEHHLERIPVGARRLVLFLGGTIGNFAPAEANDFLVSLTRQLAPGDFVLIGMDLRKPAEVLHAAYNDAAGLTAEFNRNVLCVINRELDADFRPEEFEHLAFFNAEASQVEMHLRARRDRAVRIRALGLTVPFAAGETIHTEISRKFHRTEVEQMFAGAGCRMLRWYVPSNDYFALVLGRVEKL